MPDWIEHALEEIRSRSEWRSIESWSAPGPYLEREGRRFLNLASNDYLGLSAHPSVREAAARAAREVAPGSTASRLLAGSTDLHIRFEGLLAQWRGHPAALTFSSGYLAALGVIPILAEHGDLILADRLSHACLLDAVRLSGARFFRFRHNDLHDLVRRLERRRDYRRCLIVTESVFSMDGDSPPLPQLLEVARQYEAILLVDEAHALGVLGPRGAGLTADEPANGSFLISMGTMGKSLGAAGGFVTCSTNMRDLLVNRARTFIFDTAPPPPVIAAAEASVRLIQANPHWPAELCRKATSLRERLANAGISVGSATSHILPVFVGDNEKALRIAAFLKEEGILAPAIRPPTVPAGTARLRLSVSLAHDDRDLERAAQCIVHAFEQC